MKLTPYYLLFSLAFFGLVGQKAYEYKLEQDDKKEVFCKNALFLLQAPDSLSNRVVDFDLPMDLIKNFVDNRILIDSCHNDLFYFCSIIELNSNNGKKILLFPFRLSYISICNPITYEKPIESGYTINFIDNNSTYTNIFSKNRVLNLKDLSKNFYEYQKTEKLKLDFNFTIRFKEKVNKKTLTETINTICDIYLKNLEKLSNNKFGKTICELSPNNLIFIKNKSNLRVDLQFCQYYDLPPPPPPK
ncbi:MAG: hypothetical protein U0V04_02445 [Spirosomataceae bacterium]|jgi:hypothetical protein